MTKKNDNQMAEISYPREWTFKIIGLDELKMREATACIAEGKSCTILHSKTSTKGKYISLNIKLMIFSSEENHDLYYKFNTHNDIKFVL